MSQLESFRVLLVDDDARLLESMEAVWADQFAVHCCTSGAVGDLLDQVPEDRKVLGILREPFGLARVNQFAGIAHLKLSHIALKAAVPGDRK